MNDKTITRDDYEIGTRLTLSLNLADFISLSGKSQNQVAREAGLASSTLSSYMTGARYPRPAQLQSLAKALGVSVAQLVNGRETDANTEALAKGADDLSELLTVARQLNARDRQTLIEFAVFLYGRHDTNHA